MMNSILHFLLAAIPVQLKFQIKMKFFHVFSCVLAVILLLISNQFNIFLYGAPLFPVFSIPLCFLFGVLFGWGYVQCAKYEFRSIEDNKFKNEWLKPALKHLIQMHVLSFLALNVYKIFAICYFYPATFLGISMLSAVFVIYNRFVDEENIKPLEELDVELQFLISLIIGVFGVCYGALCTYVFGVMIGFDLTIASLSIWCSIIWLALNTFGVEFISFEQQFYVSCFVFAMSTVTLCICQMPLLSCLLYLTPALNYYPLSSWLSNQKSSTNQKLLTNEINLEVVPELSVLNGESLMNGPEFINTRPPIVGPNYAHDDVSAKCGLNKRYE